MVSRSAVQDERRSLCRAGDYSMPTWSTPFGKRVHRTYCSPKRLDENDKQATWEMAMSAHKILRVLTSMALVLASGTLSAAGPPLNGGTVFVTAKNADEGDDTSMQMSFKAASKALALKGFTFLDDPDHAAYIADVVVRRVDVGTGQERVHAGSASMMGAGVNVPFSTGQSKLVPLQRTELEISIRKRGETNPVWHGAAVTVRIAGSREGDAENVVSTLSAAALQNYPRQASEAVGVP